MYALIVIDQQKGIDHPKLGRRNNPNAEQIMLDLIAFWRNRNWPIIHIIHRSEEPDSVFWPEQDGFTLKEEFRPVGNELLIEKSVPCAFTKNTLADELTKRSLHKLVITGVATNNSVEATARSAGNLGFEAFVVADACFTFEKPDYFGNAHSADEVHAMSLANIHGEYAAVIESAALKLLLTD